MQQAGEVARRRIIQAGLRLALLLGADRIRQPTPPTDDSGFAQASNHLTPKEPQPSDAHRYWLNTSSNVRHNQSCKWFGDTKHGRYCFANEGKPCRECGG
jgi:hypothetical protein